MMESGFSHIINHFLMEITIISSIDLRLLILRKKSASFSLGGLKKYVKGDCVGAL